MLRVMLLGIKQKIQMIVFADMLVIDREGSLIAMRFGGYPETVQAIKAALSGNCRLTVESMDGLNRREVKCAPAAWKPD